MKIIITLALALLIFSPVVIAGVFINEVELNPNGSPDLEWIEFFNNGPSVDLTGWYVKDRDNNQFFFPPVIISDFYVLEGFSNDFVNSDENVSLFDANGTLIDNAPHLTDSSNNGRTWQRVPDGVGDLLFEIGTKGITNLPTLIENESVSKTCIVESEDVSLVARVTGFCIDEVLFSIDLGGWMNFSTLKIGDNYTYTIPAGNLSAGNTNWRVYSIDCFNRTVAGGIQAFSVLHGTNLDVSPSSPSGLNGWYKTEPQFTLNNVDASKKWYQWDGDDMNSYTGPFGLELIPNAVHGDGSIDSAGLLTLKWFSNVCSSSLGRNESKQERNFKVDLTNPFIKNMIPSPNSIVHSNPVEISAYIDEIYNGNSGINLSSIRMRIDGLDVVPNVGLADSIDARVNYTVNLSEENHTVRIDASDNSGRSSYIEWEFELNIASDFFINVLSPLDSIYEKKKVLFNLTTSDINSSLVDVEKIEFINYNDKTVRWTTLCVECSGYERGRNLNEGPNSIDIRATRDGNVKTVNFSIFIDSKKPIVHSMLPKKNDVVNGSRFWLGYTEENLKKVLLYVNQTDEFGSSQEMHELTCLPGKRQECAISLDLSAYDGKKINYWYSVEDDINTLITKKLKVIVDTTNPVLIINMPQNGTYTNKKVPFNITISEKVDLEYIDSWDVRPQWKKICSSCDSFGFDRVKTKTFSKGIHSLMIKATDEAGNSDDGSVGFLVDY